MTTIHYNPTKAPMMKRTRFPRIRISYWAIALIFSLAIGIVGGALLATAAKGDAPAAPRPYYWHIPTKPCTNGDEPHEYPADRKNGCFYDAGVRGNGKGYSFWMGRNGKFHYLTPGGRRTR